MSDSCSTNEIEWADLKGDFIRLLSKVESSGSYATYGVFETFPSPGISVDGVGGIPTELDQQSAQSLIKVSDKAPFGKGNQTLVDETIRKTWEIAGSKVSFRNPAWHDWLKDIVERVAKDLGVASPKDVRAELYQMLLYEKGAMFKPHKDTEKTPGMFGTLVICLPSIHIGGTVQVTHGEQRQKFATDKTSEFNISYTAFYADVTHEILPVQSGHRWVLTYNLIKTSLIFPESAASLDDRQREFCEILNDWDNLFDDERPLALCYALDHQYTDTGINLASLKGVDYPRACFTVDCCRETKRFNVFFASLQKVVTIMEEWDSESHLEIGHIVHSGGFRAPNEIIISDSLLIQNDLHDSRHPDEEIGATYFANKRTAAQEIYKDTVMIIVRKEATSNLFLGKHSYSFGRFKDLLDHLQRFRIEDEDSFVRDFIVQACEHDLKIRDRYDKDKFLGAIAVAATFIRDKNIFRRTVDALTHALDEDTSRDLGKLISFQEPAIPIEDFTRAFCKPPMYKLYRSLQAFGTAYGKGFEDQLDNKHANLMTSWMRDRLYKALESATNVYPPDAPVLIEIAKESKDQALDEWCVMMPTRDSLAVEKITWLTNLPSVRAFITRFLTTSEFVNVFAVEILSFSQSSIADQDLIARLFPLVQDAVVAQFELQQYSSLSLFHSYRDIPYSSWLNCENVGVQETEGYRNAKIIVDLYQRVFKSDQTTALQLLDKIQSQTKTISQNELKRLVCPLLKQMLQVLNKSLTEACGFYRTIMTTYIMRTVRKEPKRPKDWSRPDEAAVTCCITSCNDCATMKEFLMDPEKQSHKFDSLEDPDHFRYKNIGTCNKNKSSRLKLIVTKTTKAWEKAHRIWKTRASAAQAELQRFPQEELKQILGIHYKAIMDLRMVKVHDSVPPAIDHITTSSQTALPQKRKRSDPGP